MQEYELIGKLKAFSMELYADARKAGYGDGSHVVIHCADKIAEIAETLMRPVMLGEANG